jgi:tripartite-type tricarboxylate transporter receptor subunit TctC
MKSLKRRQFLQLAASAAAMPVMSRVASAEAYPSRPVRLLVGFAPGGGTDVMARLLQPALSERLGQQIVIENRPGAGTNIATEDVLNGIGKTGRQQRVAIGCGKVTPSLPVNTIPELIAYAKAHPGKVNMGSGGIGSGNQLTGEMFKMMAGIDLVHVPYRGAGPAMVDLMGGQVQVMFNTMSASLQHVRAGKLRALGVATKTRQAALPDVPTVAEFVPGYEASFWTGIAAPKGMSPEIIDKLNKAVNAALEDPQVKARLAEWGATALAGSPADFAKFVADETEKWGKVIRAANIKAE